LHYYAIVGREIPFQLHNTRGPRPSWRSAFRCTPCQSGRGNDPTGHPLIAVGM